MKETLRQVGERFRVLEGYKQGATKQLVLKRWEAVFECHCGQRFVCQAKRIKSGNTQSCGCHNNRVRAERGRRQLTTHGMTRTREFRSWESAIQRCHNANATGYERYGGAGVVVCERWRGNFSAFYEDMGPRPEGTTLDRIDPWGNYEPSNCRWADRVTQSRNQKRYLTRG